MSRLERSDTDRMIGGVCGGIGEYLQVDATFVRIVFVLLGLGFIGIVLYIALLIIMPLPAGARAAAAGAARSTVDAGTAAGATETDGVAPDPVARSAADPAETDRRRSTAGYVLMVIGGVFLLGNLGVLRGLDWDVVWPLLLIGLGVLLLVQRTRR